MSIKDNVKKAEQHLKVLEKLRADKMVMLPYFNEIGKGTAYDKQREVINALNFAIDFIKWGMK